MKNWIIIKTTHPPVFVINRINTRKSELLNKLRITKSEWEVDEDHFEEVMRILDELKLNFSVK